MRPRKIRHYDLAEDLLNVFSKVRDEMKAEERCNQYQIAEKVKTYFSLIGSNIVSSNGHFHSFSEVKRLEGLAIEQQRKAVEHFGITSTSAWNLALYIREASPAAIVQMVKRTKSRLQVQN